MAAAAGYPRPDRRRPRDLFTPDRVHVPERQLWREMDGRQGDDLDQEQQHLEQDRAAARVRRFAAPFGRGRAAAGFLANCPKKIVAETQSARRSPYAARREMRVLLRA